MISVAVDIGQGVDLRAKGRADRPGQSEADRHRQPAFDLAVPNVMLGGRQFHEWQERELDWRIFVRQPVFVADDHVAEAGRRAVVALDLHVGRDADFQVGTIV